MNSRINLANVCLIDNLISYAHNHHASAFRLDMPNESSMPGRQLIRYFFDSVKRNECHSKIIIKCQTNRQFCFRHRTIYFQMTKCWQNKHRKRKKRIFCFVGKVQCVIKINAWRTFKKIYKLVRLAVFTAKDRNDIAKPVYSRIIDGFFFFLAIQMKYQIEFDILIWWLHW